MDLKQYRQKKIAELKKLLDPIYQGEIDFIWVGGNSRRKITLQVDQQNNLGFFQEKTHNLIEINDYSTITINIQQFLPKLKEFVRNQEQNLFSQIIITEFDNGIDLIFKSKRQLNFSQTQQLLNFAKTNDFNASLQIENQQIDPIFIAKNNHLNIANLTLRINNNAFLQATKIGLESIVNFIQNNLEKNYKVADLYSGCGFYAFSLANLAKKIEAFEGDESMVKTINDNCKNLQLADKINGFARDLFFNPLTSKELKKYQGVIINPPRAGANPQIKQIANCQTIEKLIYVSCNPQTFLSDSKIVIERYFKLAKIIAIDQFFLTKHLEIVAVFEKI